MQTQPAKAVWHAHVDALALRSTSTSPPPAMATAIPATEPDPLGPRTAPALPTEVGMLELDGGMCRVLRVDGLVPRHAAERRDDRTRLRYLPREIAHFDWSGHRYAVVPAAEPERSALVDGPDAPSTDVARLLTRRELQIVQLICLGYLTKQVADRLHLSEFTVRSYLKSTYAKLGVRSRAALVYRYTQAFQGAVSADAGD